MISSVFLISPLRTVYFAWQQRRWAAEHFIINILLTWYLECNLPSNTLYWTSDIISPSSLLLSDRKSASWRDHKYHQMV